MVSKHKAVFDLDDVVFLIRIIISQVLQDSNLHSSLINEFLLVSYDLQSDGSLPLVIEAFYTLTK